MNYWSIAFKIELREVDLTLRRHNADTLTLFLIVNFYLKNIEHLEKERTKFFRFSDVACKIY